MHIYLIIKKDLIFSTATARGLQEESKHTQVKLVLIPAIFKLASFYHNY